MPPLLLAITYVGIILWIALFFVMILVGKLAWNRAWIGLAVGVVALVLIALSIGSVNHDRDTQRNNHPADIPLTTGY